MIRRIDLRGQRPEDYRDVVPRADFDIEAAVPAVHAICEAVRTRGLEAILEMSEQYDGVTQTDIRVPPERLQEGDIRARIDFDTGAYTYERTELRLVRRHMDHQVIDEYVAVPRSSLYDAVRFELSASVAENILKFPTEIFIRVLV